MILSNSITLLKKLNENNLRPKLWLRDDDFCATTANFYSLINNLSTKFDIIFSAVPYRFKLSLLDKNKISTYRKNIYFCAHGFNHINNVTIENQQPSEFPENRNIEEVSKEIQIAYQAIKGLIEERFLPMFVPPWDYIHESYLNILSATGFKFLSASYGRKQNTNDKFKTLNINLDILNYESDNLIYPLKSTDEIDEKLAQLIIDWESSDEKLPIGIVSHHNAMQKDDIITYCKIVNEIESYFDPYIIESE